MAGNKNSGRRPMSVEMKRRAIIDKAWIRVERLIDSPGKMGDTVARDVAVKDQTTKVDADINANVTIMPVVSLDGKPLEYNIGTDRTTNTECTE